jgi:hypothetical protein
MNRESLVIAEMLLPRRRMHRKITTGLVILILVGALYALFLWTLPRAKFWVSLTATSESVKFRVVNPDFAVIHISGMEAHSSDPKAKLTGCVAGVVTPANGSSIEYRRGSDDFFKITIDSRFGSPNGTVFRFRPAAQNSMPFEVTAATEFRAKKDCGTPPARLPIWGPAKFGDRLSAPGESGDVTPGLLSEGTIEVYAHAHDWLLGIKFPSSVYSVQTFDLPPGSVLTAVDDAAENWIGTASVPSDGNGFEIRASTMSPNIALQLPHAPTGTKPQRIDLGQYAQYLNDPNVIQIQFFFGVFLFLLQTVLSVTSFFELGEQKMTPHVEGVGAHAAGDDRASAKPQAPPSLEHQVASVPERKLLTDAPD